MFPWREQIKGPIPTRLFELDESAFTLTGFDCHGLRVAIREAAARQLEDRLERGQLVELVSRESGLVTGHWMGLSFCDAINGVSILIAQTPNPSIGSTLHVHPGNVRALTVLHGPRPALWSDDFTAIEEAAYIAAFEEGTAEVEEVPVAA